MKQHRLILVLIILAILAGLVALAVRCGRDKEKDSSEFKLLPPRTMISAASFPPSPYEIRFIVDSSDWNGTNTRYHVELAADTSVFAGTPGDTAVIRFKLVPRGSRFPGKSVTVTSIETRFDLDPEWTRSVTMNGVITQGKVLSQSNAGVVVKLPSVGGTYQLTLSYRAKVLARAPDGTEQIQTVEGAGSLLAIVPVVANTQKNGRLGNYPLGLHPSPYTYAAPEIVREHPEAYRPPDHFLEIRPGLEGYFLSPHFTVNDFISNSPLEIGESEPVYLVLDHRILEKMERLIDALEARGYGPVHVTINSGFRSPLYNNAERISGGGGAGSYSMHMYGKAADFMVDGIRGRRTPGVFADMDGDGRPSTADLWTIAILLDRMETFGIVTMGGTGMYVSEASNGGRALYLHTDTRGYRARWGRFYENGAYAGEIHWWPEIPATR